MDDLVQQCSICGDEFDLEAEGGMAGYLGILRAAWCPVSWNGTVEAVRQSGVLEREEMWAQEDSATDLDLERE